MKQKNWIFVSGLVWIGAGVMLLYKGLRFVAEGTQLEGSLSDQFRGVFGSPEQAGTGLIAIGLLLGFIKGRFVLSKTARRVMARILALSPPIHFSQVYAPSYWLLIAGMVGLGMSLRFLPFPVDGRGVVDIAIGSALIHGAMFYFRHLREAY